MAFTHDLIKAFTFSAIVWRKCWCYFANFLKILSYCQFVFPDDIYRSILERNELRSIRWSAGAVSLYFFSF